MVKKEEIKLFNKMRKLGLLGLGFAALSKEKAEAVIQELVKRGEMDAETGKKMAKDLIKKSKKERKQLEKKIQEQVKDMMEKMNVATKKDIKRIEKKIDKLSK